MWHREAVVGILCKHCNICTPDQKRALLLSLTWPCSLRTSLPQAHFLCYFVRHRELFVKGEMGSSILLVSGNFMSSNFHGGRRLCFLAHVRHLWGSLACLQPAFIADGCLLPVLIVQLSNGLGATRGLLVTRG